MIDRHFLLNLHVHRKFLYVEVNFKGTPHVQFTIHVLVLSKLYVKFKKGSWRNSY